MQKIEIGGDAMVVSAWKEHFQQEQQHETRCAAITRIKATLSRPIEFGVCSSMLVGDTWQIVSDIESECITRERAFEIVNQLLEARLIPASKVAQLKMNLETT